MFPRGGQKIAGMPTFQIDTSRCLHYFFRGEVKRYQYQWYIARLLGMNNELAVDILAMDVIAMAE